MLARYASALAVASIVTFALFYFMQMLVANPKMRLSNIKPVVFTDVVQVERPENVNRETPEVKKPDVPEAPPPDLNIPKASVSGVKQGISFDRVSLNNGLDVKGVNIGTPTDGDYLPLVRIEPQYPRRAAERGIEGYVVVELTVTELGTVKDVHVIEADPPGYFERAAIRAAQKFKYKPKVVNGQPIEVQGVKYIF
ncbi:MAG: energy transducer TonB, partial [Alphaproteobacteria bacterium]